jgi:di/tricarboxylate transporter
MFLILTYTAGVFDKTIIAGAAAITGRGSMETVGKVEVLWSQWLIAFLPIAIITILAAWWFTLKLYPPEMASLPGGKQYLREELRKAGQWTTLEKKSLSLMIAVVVLWSTDFIHHISPSMIGLGFGLIALMPFMRILTLDDFRKVNILQIFYVAAAISMGNVLSATKGLAVLTNSVLAGLEPLLTNSFLAPLALYWTGFVYHLFLASEISMLATSTPLLMQFAVDHGLSALKLGMLWVFASSGKIFVYQSAVLVVGYGYGYFRAKDILWMGLLMSIVDSALLLLVVPYFWPLVGIR